MIDVFDFDHTIYDGDASLDFYLYCLRRHPEIVRYVPAQLWQTFLYVASIISRTKFKEGFFTFLNGLNDVDNDLEEFWKLHEKKLGIWYITRPHSQDVIISASPYFILEPIGKKLGVKRLIATSMNKTTGRIEGKNCRGSEKVKRLRSELGNPVVNECYTDSLSDVPILNLAKDKYIVKKQRVLPYDEYKPSRFKQKFFRKSFLTFIFVGGLNALIGLSLAFLVSIFLDNKTIAFMIGYCLGLIPSYFLNSTMTFHNKHYTWIAFMKYCLSYIPNFFIQTFCVAVLIELLRVPSPVAFILAVMVGVPVTFIIVSIFAIKSREVE